MALKFLGFKEVLKSTYDGLEKAKKLGYLWFVKESADAESGEIYLGERKYGAFDASLQDSAKVEVVVNDTATSTVLKSYTIYQGGKDDAHKVTTIDIPVDKVVKHGELMEITADTPEADIPTFDGKPLEIGTYLKLTFAGSEDIVYIDVKKLVDVYKGDNSTIKVENGIISTIPNVFTSTTEAKAFATGENSFDGQVVSVLDTTNNVVTTYVVKEKTDAEGNKTKELNYYANQSSIGTSSYESAQNWASEKNAGSIIFVGTDSYEKADVAVGASVAEFYKKDGDSYIKCAENEVAADGTEYFIKHDKGTYVSTGDKTIEKLVTINANGDISEDVEELKKKLAKLERVGGYYAPVNKVLSDDEAVETILADAAITRVVCKKDGKYCIAQIDGGEVTYTEMETGWCVRVADEDYRAMGLKGDGALVFMGSIDAGNF